jgi:type IV secretory pathway VirD2 relaxase
LENNRDIIKKNVESVKHRLSQEYYCKLKQLEVVAKKGEELDQEIRKL